MTFLDNLSSFALIASMSGNVTVKHCPSNSMIHSLVNPIKEANDIAQSCGINDQTNVLLIGGGLGYLAEAVADRTDSKIIVIEPLAELYEFAKHSRPQSEYISSSKIEIHCSSTSVSMLNVLESCSENYMILVSPYLFNENLLRDNKISALIQLIRSAYASKNTYLNSASGNMIDKGSLDIVLHSISEIFLPIDKTCVICGAGPSLTEALPVIKSQRDKINLIAVSGAVPSLVASNIHPDWVVALEANNTVSEDVRNLAHQTNIIAFSTTNPNLYKLRNHKFFVGDNADEEVLETWGGTTVTPAIDFALKFSESPIIIAGVDLTNQYGEYAANSKRDNKTIELNYSPPKFTAMRYGINRVLEKHSLANGNREVYHFTKSPKILNTTTRVNASDMKAVIENQSQVINI